MEMYISESAVEELLGNHESFLNQAYRLCRDWSTAEDVVQEAYIKVIKCARNETGLKNYMHRTINHAFIDIKRKEARRPVLKECDFAGKDSLDLIPAQEIDPYKQEISDPVAKALRCIPPPRRDVFVDYALGQTPAEIGRERGIPAGTVSSRVSRTQKTLKEILQKTGF